MIWISKIERKLSKIQKLEIDRQNTALINLLEEIGLFLPHTMQDNRQKQIYYFTNGIHTWLQTKMMLSACRWAAAAAILAFVSSVVALITVFSS